MGKNNLVAIIGRPNVGKSCLFNRLVGYRQVIVDQQEGITRDRVYASVDWDRRDFAIVDTGGICFSAQGNINFCILSQAKQAVEEAELLLLVVDSKIGPVAADLEIIEFLRPFKKKIILVPNKADNSLELNSLSEFYEMGIEAIVAVSALHGLNIDDLLDLVISKLDFKEKANLEEKLGLKVAIIGRPNVGKSSFLNKILKQDRMIVDDFAGTTRDAVDTAFIFNEQEMILIDTAGIRRAKKTYRGIDIYSSSRTISAVKRADVCVLLLDAGTGILRDDMQLFKLVKDQGKCCVILINKADTVNLKLKNCLETLNLKAYFISFAFVGLCSVKFDKSMDFALKFVQAAWENSQRKISQQQLNKILKNIITNVKGKSSRENLKLHYLTQVRRNPQTFVLIVNNPAFVKTSDLRYVERELRKNDNFQGAPIKVLLKRKTKQKNVKN